MQKLELLNAWSAHRQYAPEKARELFASYIDELNAQRVRRPLRVLVAIGSYGTALWRALTPMLEVARDPRFDVRIGCSINNDDLAWCDVLWLHHVLTPQVLIPLDAARQAGKRVVFDIDDWIHGIPDYNPAHARSVQQKWPLLLEKILAAVDVASFSTEHLANLYRPLSKRVTVLPNCIDLDVWQQSSQRCAFAKTPDTYTIGWAGSPTHYADLKLIEPAIAEVMHKRENVWFMQLGCFGEDMRPTERGYEHDDPLKALPQDRVMRFMFDYYPHTLGKYMPLIDVALAPLVDNQFNRSKSDVKLLDHAQFGTPVIASNLAPYQWSPELCMHICNDANWVSAIEYMLDNEHFRNTLGQNAKEYALTNRTIQTNVCEWTDLLLGL